MFRLYFPAVLFRLSLLIDFFRSISIALFVILISILTEIVSAHCARVSGAVLYCYCSARPPRPLFSAAILHAIRSCASATPSEPKRSTPARGVLPTV